MTLNLDCNYDSIIEVLIEEVNTAIPDDLKQKLQSMEFRKELLAKHGKAAFLDATRLKFPIYDETGINCHLLYASYLRSASRATTGSSLKDGDYYAKISKKAKNLFNKTGCSEKLQVQLHEDDALDYIDLTEIFEYDTDLQFVYIE
jgi:hypothetical protein